MKNIIIQLILFCCMIPTVLAQNKIKQYEYWLDNDYAGRQIVSITPTASYELTALPANALIKAGLHRLNIRFLDTNNKYSAVVTQYVEGFTVNPQITAYEYWFDDAYNAKMLVTLTSSSVINLKTVDATSVANGIHTLNIRFQDHASKWSAVQTAKIHKSAGATVLVNAISGYRYWFDTDFGNSVYKSLNSPVGVLKSMETLDLSGFPTGNNHVLNIQFKDALGMWSAVQSTKLYNYGPGSILNNAVASYRYWVDSDFANAVYKTVNPSLAFVSVDESIDLSAFKGNNRMLNIQFKDALGMWSSVVTDTVSVPLNAGLANLEYADAVQVYPNPTKGRLTISTNGTLNTVHMSITNTLGKIVYLQQYDNFTDYNLNLSNLSPGVYFIRLVDSDNNKAVTRKIILQN